jgi:hypothetical protein
MINNLKSTFFSLLVFLLILISCSRNKVITDIKIDRSKDTVAVDEMFVANLHLDNYKDRLPEFFIVGRRDTFRLEFNDTIKSAMFKATSNTPGNKIYKGFAQYVDSLGNNKKEEFLITFIVK